MGFADEAGCRDPRLLLDHRIHIQVAVLPVKAHDGVQGILGQRLEFTLAFAQRMLGQLALGDVAEHTERTAKVFPGIQ